MVKIINALCIAAACASARGLRSDVDVGSTLYAEAHAIPVGAFNVGQPVQVRDSEQEDWKVGTVTSLDPFKVTPEGWDEEFRWKFVRPSVSPAMVQKRDKAAVVTTDEAPDPEAALMPQLPDEPGCYVWMPSGCPRNMALNAFSQWHRDEYGEEHGALSPHGCAARANSFNSWCGAMNARMHLVLSKAPPAPSEPGCYVRHPTGCPKQNLRAHNSWKRDAYGEDVLHAVESRAVCETDRKRMFDGWCGTDDTDMVFVDQEGHSGREPVIAPADVHALATPMLTPKGAQDSASPAASSPEEEVVREPGMPELPAEPGCFVWMPSGCPKTKAFKATAAWKRDEYGEEERGASVSKKACQARASNFNSWCGAIDARMLFIAAPPPAAPATPGCYVFHRSGCPKQIGVRVRNEWERDTHGEATLKAAESREACESARKRAFDAWCGVDDTAMTFVPKAGENSTAAADQDLEMARHIASADRADILASSGSGHGSANSASASEAMIAGTGEGTGGHSIARSARASQVIGDRVTNLNGQEFKIRQPGNYTLLELPQKGASSLVVEGRVEAAWPCTLFVREVALSGSALGKDTLRVRVGSQHAPDTGLEVQTWQEGAWMPLANLSTPSQHKRHFWAWLRPKLSFLLGRHQSDSAQVASSVVALKTYKAAEKSAELLVRKTQVGSDGTEADVIEINTGGSVLRVSQSGAKNTTWLDVALDASGATAPKYSGGSLTGLLAYDKPHRVWLEPTEECAPPLGEGHRESHARDIALGPSAGFVSLKD